VRVSGAHNARLTLKPLAEMNEGLAKLGHPAPEVTETGGVRMLCQSIPAGLSYAVAWNPAGPDHFLAIETAATATEAREAARAAWRAAAAAGLDCLHDEHVAAWREFWRRSAVHLPEERIEFLWYFGLYLLASAARRGQLPPGLQGVWAMDGVLPPWRGEYATNVNIQETFWPALAAGHLDLMDCWCDFMRECLPHAQDFTRRFFGSEGAFTVSAIRRAGRTVWVSVRAGVDRRLRLRDPFGGVEVTVSGAALARDGDLLVAELRTGQEVVVCLPGETGDLDAAVADVRTSDTSRLGLRGRA
jgi:hypothetical protein